MILTNPAGTADKLEVIIGTAADIDTLAEGTEADSPITPTTNVIPFKETQRRTTAATHTLCAGPASTGDVRTVQRVSIYNKDSTDTTLVTVQIDENGTKTVVAAATLAPGEALRYSEDAVDWFETASGIVVPGSVYNQSTAAQTPGTSDTYVTNSNLLVSGRIKVGTRFQWRLHMSKTAAGAAAPSVIIRCGTAGAIGDTARVTMAGPVQTAVVDEGVLLVEAVVRTAGSSGILQGNMGIQHSAAVAAGFGEMFDAVTSSAFDMTVSGLQVGISVIPNTSAAWTITQVQAQAENLT